MGLKLTTHTIISRYSRPMPTSNESFSKRLEKSCSWNIQFFTEGICNGSLGVNVHLSPSVEVCFSNFKRIDWAGYSKIGDKILCQRCLKIQSSISITRDI